MSLRSLDGPTGCGATYRRGYCLPSETDLPSHGSKTVLSIVKIGPLKGTFPDLFGR